MNLHKEVELHPALARYASDAARQGCTYCVYRLGIVTLTGLVFEDDPAVASLDAQLILQAPPLPA